MFSQEPLNLDYLYQEKVALRKTQAKLVNDQLQLAAQLSTVKRKLSECEEKLKDVEDREQKRMKEIEGDAQVMSNALDKLKTAGQKRRRITMDSEEEVEEELVLDISDPKDALQLVLAKLIVSNGNNFPNPNTHFAFGKLVEDLHKKYQTGACDRHCEKDSYNRLRCVLRLLPNWKFYYCGNTFFFQIPVCNLDPLQELCPEDYSVALWEKTLMLAAEGKSDTVTTTTFVVVKLE